MKTIKQPKDSELCGQACLAMVRNIKLDEAVKLMGTDKGTTYWQMRAVMDLDRVVEYRGKLPKGIALLMVSWQHSDEDAEHWALSKGGEIYCPGYGRFDSLEQYKRHWSGPKVDCYSRVLGYYQDLRKVA